MGHIRYEQNGHINTQISLTIISGRHDVKDVMNLGYEI